MLTAEEASKEAAYGKRVAAVLSCSIKSAVVARPISCTELQLFSIKD
jgi:hypothetical protein